MVYGRVGNNSDIVVTIETDDRSYGSVFKATHKRTGNICAIKVVPVEDDLEDVQKEISIASDLKDARHVVQFYGSYIKEKHIWVGD